MTINKTGIIAPYIFFLLVFMTVQIAHVPRSLACPWLSPEKSNLIKGIALVLTLNCEQWRAEKAINTSVSVGILSRH